MALLNVHHGGRSARGDPRGNCLIGLAGAAALVIAGAVSAQGSEIYMFETGFEPFPDESPGYVLGDLHGQNGWVVTPKNAAAFVVDDPVFTGLQAMQLLDGASFGRAQMNINQDITLVGARLRWNMMLPSEWLEVGDEVDDRFEAQARLELTDLYDRTWGVEGGFLATFEEYNGLPAGGFYWFLEVTQGEVLYEAIYMPVTVDSVMDTWHQFRIHVDNNLNGVHLRVNGEQVGEIFFPVDFPVVNTLQLQNQRWGTSLNNNAPLYYDVVRLADVGYERVLPPTSFRVVQGQLLNGDLPDLFENDNSRVIVRPESVLGHNQIPPVQVEYTTFTEVLDPVHVYFILEGNVSKPDVVQRIYMFNYVDNVFEEVDARFTDTMEITYVVYIDQNPQRFVNQDTGEMKALTTWLSVNVFSFYLVEEIDQAVWHVE